MMRLRNKIFLALLGFFPLSLAATAQNDVFTATTLMADNPNFTGDAWLSTYVSQADSGGLHRGQRDLCSPECATTGTRTPAGKSLSAHRVRDVIKSRAKRFKLTARATW